MIKREDSTTEWIEIELDITDYRALEDGKRLTHEEVFSESRRKIE